MRIGEKMLLHNLSVSFFVTCCLALFSMPIIASETSEQIHSAVKNFVQNHEKTFLSKSGINADRASRIETKIGYVDPRLNLKPCQIPLEVNFRHSNKTTGRLTTKVSCNTGSLWSLYVPVTIDLYQRVAIANTPIPRGAHLQQHHLRLEEKNISMLYRGYYFNTKPLLGFVTTRAIKIDEVISPRNLTAPKVIYRNEEVTIIAKAGGLRVRASGVALSDGVLGETISVRNKNTKKIVEARVRGPGKVEIQI